MTEMITFLSSNISDPHFFIEVKSKKNLSKTCSKLFAFCLLSHAFLKKRRGYFASVCLSVRLLCYLLLNHWGAKGSKIKFHPAVCLLCYLLLNRWTKFNPTHMNGACNGKKKFGPTPWWPLGEVKGQISLNFGYHVNFKDFYTKLCVCFHKWKIQNISDGILILLPGSCPRGGTLGHWGCPRGQFFFSNMVM